LTHAIFLYQSGQDGSAGVLFPYEQLLSFTIDIFKKIAVLQTMRLLLRPPCSADLRGIDSHGVARLIGYVRLWEPGGQYDPAIRIIMRPLRRPSSMAMEAWGW